ncbi:MAG TPA: maleylpyruvate isomerase N-terminal domain-containing protein [Mycobacteriales bacterium]|nr:maleylpyruvate isomerase N-terminal domain-containing protein [Mycobacteriales bacterium]
MIAPGCLLGRAVQLATASIERARSADPWIPTPCTGWDLATLVRHVADSAATVRALIEAGPADPPPAAGCAAALAQLRRLHAVTVPGETTLAGILGAYELTVHAWDIDQATGRGSLPGDVVETLLVLAPLVLPTGPDRSGLFDPEVPPADAGTDCARLLALFGRRPGLPL